MTVCWGRIMGQRKLSSMLRIPATNPENSNFVRFVTLLALTHDCDWSTVSLLEVIT